MPRPRTLLTAVFVAALAVVMSGCVSIKQQIALQSRLPGFVTLRVDVCVSDRDKDTYGSCNPNVRGGFEGTAEPDNGFDGDEDGAGRGQLLVGYRVPDGTTAPGSFASGDGQLILAKSASYTAALTSSFKPPAGFHWEGYLSSEVPFNPAISGDRQTTLSPEFALPPGTNGAPFVGPFRWRAVVGFRATGTGNANPNSSVNCSDINTTICFDSPSTGIANHLSNAVSDLGVLAGSAVTAGPGETASVAFRVQNLDANNRGARTVALTATTTVPGGTATPTTITLPVPANATPTTTVAVPIPPSTPAGTYTVALTASANNGGGTALTRTSTTQIVVVDKTSPTVRISTPADGATFTTGQKVAADFGCTDEGSGSGIASGAGPAGSGAPIDTSSPGVKTFTVDATDAAGNAATLTHTYKVVPPAPPVVLPAPAPGRVVVTIAFDAPKAPANSTTFSLLQVKGAPSGSTIEVTCKGKACPKSKGKAIRLTKRNPPRVFSLKPWLKKPLRAGTVLTVTVTKPGSFGMVKTFTVRASTRPRITERCLQPNSKTARATCDT
jgi:hypothetical protein